MVLLKIVLLSQDLFGFPLFSKTRLQSPLLFRKLVATLSGSTTVPRHLGQKQGTLRFYADLCTGVHKMNLRAYVPIKGLALQQKRERGEPL